MTNISNRDKTMDKKKLLRELGHLTRPPRFEGALKNKMVNLVKKKKKTK